MSTRIKSSNINDDIEKVLNDLAYELSTNYCTTSFGDLERSKVNLSHIFAKDSICLNNFKNTESEKSTESKEGTPPKVSEPKVSDILRHRNILIVGAGASHDSYKCIPLGQQLIDQLKKRYESSINQFDGLKRKYDKRVDDLVQERGVNNLDFETYMSLFSEFILSEEEIRDFLHEFTEYKNSPSLFYEVAAHMFKHSFIDVIINFNFDELLDNAIEEELGRNNYRFVLSDGDCFDVVDAMVDGRIKTPIYIKPHGTVSHKTSLRFTKSHYLEMSTKMKEFIAKLVSGYCGEDKRAISKVNLISVGFNMESVEFKKILQEHLPHESRIFHFMFSDPATEKDEMKPENYVKNVLDIFYKRVKESIVNKRTKSYDHVLKKHVDVIKKNLDDESKKNPDDESKKIPDMINDATLGSEIFKRINIHGFNSTGKINSLTSPFSELFCVLWRLTENQFKKSYVPRSISRHEIISYLFYDTKYIFHDQKSNNNLYTRDHLRKSYEENVFYYRDRVIVEIAIAINRNKGIVDVTELMNDRVGIYYERYRHCYLKSEGKRRGVNLYTIFDFMGFFMSDEDRNSFQYARNIFRLKPLKRDDIINSLEKFEENRTFIVLEDVGDGVKVDMGLLNMFVDLLKGDEIFDEANSITPTVLYYLFRCPALSSKFLVNLKRNYDLECYNGKATENQEPNANPMFKELCRLFNKSSKNHYFQIKPKYDDRKNYTIESFSKRKLIHTNLSLEYEIRRILSGEKWDRILVISEVGSFFQFISHWEKEDKLHGDFKPNGKKIIMLNSLEAVESRDEKLSDYNGFLERHKLKIFPKYQNGNQFPVEIHTMPFWQHNHHMLIFMKKIESHKPQIEKEYPFFELDENRGFAMIGSFYMYRHGFSNQISPVYIGGDPYGKEVNLINNDFHRLLSLFYMNYQRANAFEKITDDLMNIETHNDWMDNKKFHSKLIEFMTNKVW
jgi:hypothetical protein